MASCADAVSSNPNDGATASPIRRDSGARYSSGTDRSEPFQIGRPIEPNSATSEPTVSADHCRSAALGISSAPMRPRSRSTRVARSDWL